MPWLLSQWNSSSQGSITHKCWRVAHCDQRKHLVQLKADPSCHLGSSLKYSSRVCLSWVNITSVWDSWWVQIRTSQEFPVATLSIRSPCKPPPHAIWSESWCGPRCNAWLDTIFIYPPPFCPGTYLSRRGRGSRKQAFRVSLHQVNQIPNALKPRLVLSSYHNWLVRNLSTDQQVAHPVWLLVQASACRLHNAVFITAVPWKMKVKYVQNKRQTHRQKFLVTG